MAGNIELLRMLSFGDFAFALTSAQAAIRRRPEDGKLWQLLGLAHLQGGDERSAEAAMRRALALLPDDRELRQQLLQVRRSLDVRRTGEIFAAIQSGNTALAMRMARRAVEADPLDASARNNEAIALSGLGRIPEALDSFRQAVALAPDTFDFHKNLASLLKATGPLNAAKDSYLQMYRLKPDDHEARSVLAHMAAGEGRLAEAMAYCRGGASSPPTHLPAYSELLHYQSLDGQVSPAENFAAHVDFGRRAAAGASAEPHANDRNPERCLRVGFVSADLRHHPVAGFIGPVWAALNPARVQIWVYANRLQGDSVTDRLRALSHHWRDVAHLGDAELAMQIRADAIDVLFDLSGHTGNNRLLSFAMKPAPVQVTWIGYPNTTGLQEMDYALCDRFNAPPGLYEHFYVEKFARIPCSGSFAPLSNLPDVNALPALGRRSVTFCSFNRIEKLGPQVLRTWARVMQALPDARLLLGHASEPSVVARLCAEFAEHGIASDRLLFRPALPLADYLLLHHECDLMLDTWPYTGGTTTNYALAMGVPVVTLQGPGRAHCQSAAVLGRIGLGDWVARDVDEFVAIAVQWAEDWPALAQLRAGLRERWEHTPLRRADTVARGLELAVRTMWRRWSEDLPPEHFEIAHAELARLAESRGHEPTA